MITTSKPTEGIEYYNLRLEFIKTLFRKHRLDLLNKHSDKIRTFISKYKHFENDPCI